MNEVEQRLYFSNEARTKLISGISKLANAVGKTMGPNGHFVVIKSKDGTERVTKDGVSVAKEFFLDDVFENMGVNLVKQVSEEILNTAGDGTTTATILAAALVSCIDEEISNIKQYKLGLNTALNSTIDFLKNNCIKNINEEALFKIAYTSSNGDEQIAKNICKTLKLVGNDGLIDIEKSKTPVDYLELESGYKFNKGLISSKFITKPESGDLILDTQSFVLLLESKLSNFDCVIPILTSTKKAGKNLVIIAKEYDNKFVETCYENCKRGNIIIPLLLPEFGNQANFMLEDLSIYFKDCSITSEEKLMDKNFKDDLILGEIESVKSNLNYTIFKNTETPNIKNRIEQLKTLSKSSRNEHDRNKLKQRIEQLTAGYAKIFVGGETTAEMEEKFDRYEDALGACKAALKDGILPGGGTALLKKYFKGFESEKEFSNHPDYLKGIDSLKSILIVPSFKILLNSGYDIRILDNLQETSFEFGVDSEDGKIKNLVEAGIIDPYQVTKAALEKAVSIANIVSSTGCLMNCV